MKIDFKAAAERYIDWIEDGNAIIRTLKLASTMLPVAFASAYLMTQHILPAINGIMHDQNKQPRLTFEDFDARPLQIFNSVSQCIAKGYSTQDCERTYATAQSIATSIKSRWRYADKVSCQQNHQYCSSYTWFESDETTLNKQTLITLTPNIEYYPQFVAWQATVDDGLGWTVPLYQGPTAGTAMRVDGKVFQLKP